MTNLNAPPGLRALKNGGYSIRYDGKTYPLKARTEPEAMLEGWAIRIGNPNPTDNSTFGSAADAWLLAQQTKAQTIKNRRSAMKFWKTHFDKRPLATITRQQFHAWLEQASMSQNTKRQYLMILKTFYNDLISDGIITANPTAKMKKPEEIKRRREITRPDHARMMLLAKRKGMLGLRRLLFLAYHGGHRKGEIIALQGKNISPDGTIEIIQQKTGKPKDTHHRQAIRALLCHWADGDPENYLCTRPDGTPYEEATLNYDFKKLREAAGLACRIKDYRSGLALRLRRRGADFEVIGTALGNNPSTAERSYTNG